MSRLNCLFDICSMWHSYINNILIDVPVCLVAWATSLVGQSCERACLAVGLLASQGQYPSTGWMDGLTAIVFPARPPPPLVGRGVPGRGPGLNRGGAYIIITIALGPGHGETCHTLFKFRSLLAGCFKTI